MQCVAICANVAVPITLIFFFAMNLKEVVSTVIDNSTGFCIDNSAHVRDIVKALTESKQTVAYSNFNDCLSFFIFDGDIKPLEIALGKNRTYKQDTIYDLLDAMRSDGVIDEEQVSDLFAYIGKLDNRGCIYFEVRSNPECFILSDIQVTSMLKGWMIDCITDSIGRGWIGIPDTPDIVKYAKG